MCVVFECVANSTPFFRTSFYLHEKTKLSTFLVSVRHSVPTFHSSRQAEGRVWREKRLETGEFTCTIIKSFIHESRTKPLMVPNLHK